MGALLRGRRMLTAPTPTPEALVCACGHPASTHKGARRRGACYGLGCECKRFTAHAPTKTQAQALRHYIGGDGAGESWSTDGGADTLAWCRHERTIDSLVRRGWIDRDGITEAGRAALATTS